MDGEREHPAPPRGDQRLDSDDTPPPLTPDEIPDTEDLPGVEKIGENRYVVKATPRTTEEDGPGSGDPVR